MKALKIIFAAVLVIVIIYFVMCAVMPHTFSVERSVLIDAPVASVFEEVNDFSNMQHWSPWKDYDPNMLTKIEGNLNESGYRYSWKSENDKVGNGSLTRKITEAKKNISNDLLFEDFNMHSSVDWKFEPTAEGTKVTWMNSGTLPFIMRPMSGKMESMMAPDLEKGLKLLKEYCEAKPKPVVNDIKIEAVIVQAINYLSVHDTSTMSQISQKLGADYGLIQQAMVKQKLNMAGYPFAFYFNKPEDEKIVMEPGLPVDKPGKDDGSVKAGSLKAGNAVVAHYFGAYHDIGKAHNAIDQWLLANNKTATGAPWEVYITDPMVEKDSSKWQTDVYYPVQ